MIPLFTLLSLLERKLHEGQELVLGLFCSLLYPHI